MPKPRGRAPARALGRVLHLFCEGKKMEPAYIKALTAVAGIKGEAVQCKSHDGTDARSLLDRAKEYHKALFAEKLTQDQVWVIFDRDNNPNIASVLQEALTASVFAAFSSPCFEYWLLLHYRDTAPVLERPDMKQEFYRLDPRFTDKIYRDDALMREIAENYPQALRNAWKTRQRHHPDATKPICPNARTEKCSDGPTTTCLIGEKPHCGNGAKHEPWTADPREKQYDPYTGMGNLAATIVTWQR